MMIMMMVMAVQVTLLQRVYFSCEAALRAHHCVQPQRAAYQKRRPDPYLAASPYALKIIHGSETKL